MSLNVLKLMLVMGMIGHAINMYCDRILSIFPNGTISFQNIKDIGKDDVAAKMMDGVSEKVPMRSAVWGAFALFLEFFGYSALAIYTYEQAHVYGIIMLLSVIFFCIVGAAYHVKCAFSEYIFLKMGRDEKAKEMMLALLNEAPILRVCMVALFVFIVTLIIAIVTGAIGFPMWAVVFTIVPIFIIMLPFKIIGTLHIAAIASMLVWMILI